MHKTLITFAFRHWKTTSPAQRFCKLIRENTSHRLASKNCRLGVVVSLFCRLRTTHWCRIFDVKAETIGSMTGKGQIAKGQIAFWKKEKKPFTALKWQNEYFCLKSHFFCQNTFLVFFNCFSNFKISRFVLFRFYQKYWFTYFPFCPFPVDFKLSNVFLIDYWTWL